MTTQSISCAAVLNESEQNKSLKRVNEKVRPSVLAARKREAQTENATCKTENGALRKANEKLLTENQRLKVEVGTFRLLVSQMKELRERELSESSETESEEGEEEDVHPTSDDPQSKIVLNSVCDESYEKLGGFLNSDASDGETGDLEMETPEHPDEVDEVELSVIESRTETSDGEEEILQIDDTTWKPNAPWICEKCKREIRGKRYRRLQHIAVHENLKLQCPIAKCTARLRIHSLRHHLAAHHKMKSENLSKEERKRKDEERAICYKKGMQFEAQYFPEKNLSKILKKKSVANNVCKLCDAKVVSFPGQRDHIAGHLGMKISCPLSSCDYAGMQSNMFHHLNTVHLKSIISLNQKRQKRWKESQEAYNKAVRNVKHEYF